MKTLEKLAQLAHEYSEKFYGCEIMASDINVAWFAGYETAQEHVHAALEEVEARIVELEDQIAGVSKVITKTAEGGEMKTIEEMAEEAIRWVKTLSPASERCNQCACEGYRAGYKAAQQQYREAVEVLDKHKAAAEKAVTNIKNASDWVTIEKAKANENT